MFFLIRCLFWLSLVFMALPWDAASLRADLKSHVEQAALTLAKEAQALCVKDPIGCAAQAISLGKDFDIVPSQDTLRPADLSPAWRGPPITTASRRQPG